MAINTNPNLVIFPSRLGDTVIALAAFKGLVDQDPNRRWVVACSGLTQSLFQDVPCVDQVIIMERGPWGRHWRQLWPRVGGRRWHQVVDFKGSALAYTLWAKKRIVWRQIKTRETRCAQILRVCGLPTDLYPHMWVSRERLAAKKQAMAAYGPVLAMGPAANWPPKEWPLDFFMALMHKLPAYRFFVSAASHEYGGLAPLLDTFKDRLLPLPETPCLTDLAATLMACEAYIGNDSGLMHLSAACGVKTLGLFGPSDDFFYRPVGPQARWVRTPESSDLLKSRGFADPRHSVMQSLTVDEVYTALQALLAS
jgi:heptosyltransferase-3